MVHRCLPVRALEFSTVAKDALRSRWAHFKTKKGCWISGCPWHIITTTPYLSPISPTSCPLFSSLFTTPYLSTISHCASIACEHSLWPYLSFFAFPSLSPSPPHKHTNMRTRTHKTFPETFIFPKRREPSAGKLAFCWERASALVNIRGCFLLLGQQMCKLFSNS